MNGANMTEKDLGRALRELRKQQQRKDAAAAEIREIHGLIQDYMNSRGIRELTHSGYKITWKPIEYESIDVKALEAALPELVERFKVPVMAMRFKVAAAPVKAR